MGINVVTLHKAVKTMPQQIQWAQKLLVPLTENEQTILKKILNNIFIEKLEIPTSDKYCAILMFQWKQQKSIKNVIKNYCK